MRSTWDRGQQGAASRHTGQASSCSPSIEKTGRLLHFWSCISIGHRSLLSWDCPDRMGRTGTLISWRDYRSFQWICSQVQELMDESPQTATRIHCFSSFLIKLLDRSPTACQNSHIYSGTTSNSTLHSFASAPTRLNSLGHTTSLIILPGYANWGSAKWTQKAEKAEYMHGDGW